MPNKATQDVTQIVLNKLRQYNYNINDFDINKKVDNLVLKILLTAICEEEDITQKFKLPNGLVFNPLTKEITQEKQGLAAKWLKNKEAKTGDKEDPILHVLSFFGIGAAFGIQLFWIFIKILVTVNIIFYGMLLLKWLFS